TVLERVGQFLGRCTGMLLQPEDEAGINAPRASGHDEAFERRETHGGVARMAVYDSGQRGPSTQMAGHDPQPSRGPTHKLRGSTRRVGVGQTVKPIALQVPLLPPL